jgi:uncharacterized protein (UPF0276 family)
MPAVADIANRFGLPDLGLGLGLRAPHHADILAQRPPVGWFEVMTDNALANPGPYREVLHDLRRTYPLVLHGVTLDIGGTRPLDEGYVRAIARLADELDAAWVSDHLCWTGHGDRQTHDLLPVPYTRPLLAWIADRVRRVQDCLGRPLVLENPSSYMVFRCSTMPEWEFFWELADRADCALLLDVNNVHVSAANHGFRADEWLAAVPWERVVQLHVAGHTVAPTHLFDSHIGPVPDAVWQLWAEVQRRTGGRATLLEWDDEIPPFAAVWHEAQRGLPLVDGCWPRESPARNAASKPIEPRSVEVGAPPLPGEEDALYRWLLAEIVDGKGQGGAPAESYVLPSPTLQPDDRVEIHRAMYRARTLLALEQDFPATRMALGDEVFAQVASSYRVCHPSRHWALESYGAAFATFLARPGEIPSWICDLARLEQARTVAWLAAPTPLLDPAAAAAVPPARVADLRLQFAISFELLRVDHEVADAWPGPSTQAPPRQSQTIAVSRRKRTVLHRAVPPAEAELLQRMAAGSKLGEAVAAVVAAHGAAVGAELGGWLRRWAEDGAVTSLHLD